MKCDRCKKRELYLSECYPKWYKMKWGDLTITLAANLCLVCTEELFDKITNALYEDEYGEK